MAKLKDEVFIQDLKHIWNDVIGPPAFSVHRATEGTSVMKQADVLEWMNNSGVYHMKQNLWSLAPYDGNRAQGFIKEGVSA